jgi:hypothetical protein
MITLSNIIFHPNIPFQEYLKLKGYSHSFLKREINGVEPEFNETYMTRLGKLVDAILTDPSTADYDDELYPTARRIAIKIMDKFGDFIRKFQKQVSITADANYNGFVFPIKGRLDYLLAGHAVIDLKITKATNFKELIEWMGYLNQLWIYCKLAGVKKAYIMIHSITTCKTELIALDVTSEENEFYESAALKYGMAA